MKPRAYEMSSIRRYPRVLPQTPLLARPQDRPTVLHHEPKVQQSKEAAPHTETTLVVDPEEVDHIPVAPTSLETAAESQAADGSPQSPTTEADPILVAPTSVETAATSQAADGSPQSPTVETDPIPVASTSAETATTSEAADGQNLQNAEVELEAMPVAYAPPNLFFHYDIEDGYASIDLESLDSDSDIEIGQSHKPKCPKYRREEMSKYFKFQPGMEFAFTKEFTEAIKHYHPTNKAHCPSQYATPHPTFGLSLMNQNLLFKLQVSPVLGFQNIRNKLQIFFLMDPLKIITLLIVLQQNKIKKCIILIFHNLDQQKTRVSS
ncbi:hypothetical protein SESBI_45598 [Sesbania bispinosa]|nr:hypothetical protein SESBI_45598 [Sesbania bispinosa]